MRGSLLVLAAGLAACAQTASRSDASIDAPTADATTSPDGGVIAAQCSYCSMGHGQTCSVPCSSSPTVTFGLSLLWSGCGYHCCAFVPAPSTEHWIGCHCESGLAVCPFFPGMTQFARPSSRCQICGSDAGSDDASADR